MPTPIMCDYHCGGKNVATRVMEKRMVTRFIPSNKLIENYLTDTPTHWCNECWDRYSN